MYPESDEELEYIQFLLKKYKNVKNKKCKK